MVACVLLSLSPAHAAIQEIRVVGVGIDVSPEAATQKALDYARKRAVYLVLKKIHIDRADAHAATLNEAQLNRVIRGASITQTRRVNDATYADVSVSILDTVLLQELGLEEPSDIHVAEQVIASRGVLVLPIYVTKERPYLWEKENLLRAPLSSEVLRISQGVVVVPTGDFDDLRLIDFRNALTVKSDELKPMFDRYGVEEIIIAVVTREAPGTHSESTILLRRLSATEIRTEEITLPPAAEHETPDERLQEAVTSIATAASQIAISTSKQQQERLAAAVKLPIYFRFGNVREIGRMQREIRSAEGVLHLAVPAITLDHMQGVLYLSGDKEVVRKDLAKRGILVKDREQGWQVSVR